jgi:hypothetical protein
MKTACPTCGAEVEFRYDDSFVRICSYCRAAVLRTDRGVETLGKVADLVPMDSPLRLFADGHFGSKSFLLVGMAQIRHSAGGLWQEWYAKFDGGTWGWLAEAQGRYYLTLEQPAQELPPQLSFEPGATTELPVHGKMRTFTVSEMGSATYVAANGELPYRLDPNSSFRFVDLSDGAGTFATIDYGDEGDKPTLYVGSQVPMADLGIHGGEVMPTRAPEIKSARLTCPNCNASLEMRAPGQTQRIVCAYCDTLLDASSPTLAVVERLQKKATPAIPLGSKGTFSEGEMIVIGYVGRSAEVEGEWYPFEEYLLYEPKLGFRWLVQSDGHWSYVQPIATGAVEGEIDGAKYDGVKFRRYQSAPLRVDQVLGEFYWQVYAGEFVESEDSIAPPAMLSRESNQNEENWSLSTYMTVGEVQRAFGDKDLPLGSPQGVAPNQPNGWQAASNVMAIAFMLLCLSGIVFSMIASDDRKATLELRAPAVSTPAMPPEPPPDGTAPPAPIAEPPANVFFSEPFVLDAGKNIELTFVASGLDNNWAYIAADLVNEQTGAVVTLGGNIEHYSGYEDGESWSEGARVTTEMVGPQPAGTYLMRVETLYSGTGELPVVVSVKQGVFRFKYLGWAIVFLMVPFLFVGLISWSKERSRWQNSTSGKAPTTPVSILIMLVGGVFTLIFLLLKALASSNDDD